MAPTMQPLARQPVYTPTSDAMGRHEYAVTKPYAAAKPRKTASTGGGRAWSEEEELYLLQTRLQKMPYKHIAAHLKKTELACRLHYHQLSHGNNRRKRTASVSSGSSSTGHSAHSPLMPLTSHSPTHALTSHSPIHHSPIREAPTSRSSSPGSAGSSYIPVSPHASLGSGVQLPSIVGPHASPRLPSILPKPAAMTLPPLNTSPTRSYPAPHEPHSALPSATFSQSAPHSALPSATFSSMGNTTPATFSSMGNTTPPPRLDCLPPPSARHTHVDMPRLQAVYAAHRASFWGAVAADYGGGANPSVLEQAWGAGGCCQSGQPPLTPAASPEGEGRERNRISKILGGEAFPRSPQDQMMVRRMEEERCGVASA